MTIIKKTIYLHHKVTENGTEFTASEHNFDCLDQYTLITSQEVAFDIGNYDGRQVELEIVEKALEQVRASSQAQINLLLDRISKLKCITHDVDAGGVPV